MRGKLYNLSQRGIYKLNNWHQQFWEQRYQDQISKIVASPQAFDVSRPEAAFTALLNRDVHKAEYGYDSYSIWRRASK